VTSPACLLLPDFVFLLILSSIVFVAQVLLAAGVHNSNISNSNMHKARPSILASTL
jgi:hypothetical protein